MSKDHIPISGRKLVADFQSALISRATSEAAQYEAKRSESELLGQLASNGPYLNPVNLSETEGDQVARASLDAHIKKVQAEQLKTLSSKQLQSTVMEDTLAYKGKKVRITALAKDFRPFDILWFNSQHGYRSNEFKKSSLEGTIEELELDKNMLIIKPKFIRRLVTSDLKNFIVYVINPSTLEPAVEILLI